MVPWFLRSFSLISTRQRANAEFGGCHMTAVRLVVQSNPAGGGSGQPELVAYSQKLRESPGCIQAEDFRGTEYPEDLLHVELWESPAAFDAHWQRTVQSGN